MFLLINWQANQTQQHVLKQQDNSLSTQIVQKVQFVHLITGYNPLEPNKKKGLNTAMKTINNTSKNMKYKI